MITILRCRDCGDTFPIDDEEASPPACPTCGGGHLDVAGEPLL